MSEKTARTEEEIESEIQARRREEERADSREMNLNVLLLALFLLTFLLIWKNWGESGFKGPYERVNAFALERAAQISREQSNSLPAKSATDVASAVQVSRAAPLQPAPAPAPAPAQAMEIVAAIGQSGDAYGGANALFSALVASFAAWAGYLQFRALKRAQRAYQDQVDENRREKHVRQAEEKDREVARFESHFFQLLELAREARERISTTRTSPSKDPKTGSAALDAFANTIYREVNEAAEAQPPIPVCARELTYHYQAIYNRRPSALGPYFRLLFQTFKFISRSEVDLSVKLQCARIARGQMSDGSVLLLALNGMSLEGHDFVEYIEEFGLLEHMLDKYFDAFGKHLREAYRPRAFLGSEERSKSENRHDSIIPFPPTMFHWTAEQLDVRSAIKQHPYIGVGNDAQD